MKRAPDLRMEAAAAAAIAAELRDLEFDDESVELSVESETDFVEAVTLAVIRLNELAEHEAACKRLADGYRDRAGKLAIRAEQIRDVLAEALQRSGVPLPLRLDVATVSVGHPAASARVIDADEIPEDFMRCKVVKSPDMRAITQALRDGKPVAGCTLANARPSLLVRTK